MTPARDRFDEGGVALDVASVPDEAADGPGLRMRLRSICTVCRQIFGMPDYDRYLAHVAQTHPDGPVMTRGEYFASAIERRYGKGGTRCC